LAPTDPKARLEEADRIFAALAHPSRRQILMILRFRGGRMSAGEIAERFGCAWPTTSRHLKVLRDARLVTVERRGRGRAYVLEAGRLKGIIGDWLGWFERDG
jgi:DNA-binding transcriptional ArsR family regulator